MQAFPSGAQRDYERALLAMVRDVESMVFRRLGLRHDAVEGAPGITSRDIAGVRVEFGREFPDASKRLLAQGTGRKVDEFNRAAVGRQVQAVIGVDVARINAMRSGTIENLIPRTLESFTADNIKLITSIGEQYLDEVGALVTEAVEDGGRASDLAEAIRERTGVAQSRARLIARDQVAKLNGALTENRQRSLGIDAYIWRTSGDERVRDSHRELEGTRHKWSDPPSVGHPGEDFQCRCRPEPDMSSIFDD